jgi:heptosyltransferase-1
VEILQGNPLLDNIFIWDRAQKNYKYYKGFKKQLRQQRFDLSIDLHGLAKSAMLVRLAGARFKLASSSTNGMREFSWLFSKEIKAKSQDEHCIERHMEVAKYLGCDDKVEYPISVTAEDINSVRKKLAEAKADMSKIIAIHPGGGWLSRRWKTDRYAALAGRLKNELGADIILVGGKEGGASEKGLNEEITSQAGVEICDLTGKLTLKELCAFFKMCRVFVGNEAGPMHIATALETPSVAILGPTNAKRTGPFRGKTKVIQHKFSCQPCRNRNCKNVLCMDDIKISEVFDEVKKKYENTDN